MTRKKKFNKVKHVKDLSRRLLKVPAGKVVPNKKRKVLEQINLTEIKNYDTMN
jgi:hypothetical protein